jgi:alpha-tubulin suppressor-like RCC1 family protein
MKRRAYFILPLGLFALAAGPLAACGDAGLDDDDDVSGGRSGTGGNDNQGSGGSGGGGGGGGSGGASGSGNNSGGGGAGEAGGPPATVTQVSAGLYYTCALLSDGAVRCWGRGTAELGYGRGVGAEQSVGDDEPASATDAVSVGGPAAQISAGGSTCAALVDGTLRCWGSNAYGELGNGNTEPVGDDEAPGSVAAVTLGAKVEHVAVGASHTCALLEGGAVRCWGESKAGGLGYPEVTSLPAPPETSVDLGPDAKALQIALGENHACALLEGGDVRCWGASALGQLGYGNTASIGDNEAPSQAGPVPLGAKAKQIGVGGNHACALLEDGAVRCWGANGSGQLGNNGVEPVGDGETPDAGSPVDLGPGAKAVQIALGSNHTCALLEGGAVRCWGGNDVGQLGYGHRNNIGDNESPASPAAVDVGAVGGAAVTQLAAGFNHTCALLDDDSVRCWGGNEFGQLGLGNTNAIGDNESPASIGPVPVLLPRPTFGPLKIRARARARARAQVSCTWKCISIETSGCNESPKWLGTSMPKSVILSSVVPSTL